MYMTTMYGIGQPRNRTQVPTAKYHLLYTLTTIFLQMFISQTVPWCKKSVVRGQAQAEEVRKAAIVTISKKKM